MHVAVCFEDAAALPREPPTRPVTRSPTSRWTRPSAPTTRSPGGERIALAALADDTWTAPSREHLVDRACVAAGFEPRIEYVTRDPLATRGLIGAGLAVTLVPELVAELFEDVAIVPLEGLQPRRALYALTPAAGVRESALAFLDALRPQVSNPRA